MMNEFYKSRIYLLYDSYMAMNNFINPGIPCHPFHAVHLWANDYKKLQKEIDKIEEVFNSINDI